MEEHSKSYPSYAMSGHVNRKSNLFIEKILRLLHFRRMNFDQESIALLKEYQQKGSTVFASFQSHNTSLLILVNLLRQHSFKIPELVLGYKPYFFQNIIDSFRKIFFFFGKFFSKDRFPEVSDEQYIREAIAGGNSIVVSLLSRKLFRRRYLDIKTGAIQHLIEIQKNSEEPIYIFPQMIFWNRNPERTRAFMTMRATGDRGFLSGLFTIFKSGTPPFMRISVPINLKEEIENSSTDDVREIERNVRNKLMECYNHEKRSILGPVIKTQQELMERVLDHKNVLDTISEILEKEKTTEKKQRKLAYKYYREITADFSILYIKYFERSLRFVFSKIFDGIKYDIDDFRKMREASQKGPLIMVPAHKSHMDYLIISSMMYRNKLIPPHILSGANLNFFPMGKIFRRSGAFFMRRSFRGLDLYAAIFKQYIKTLVNEGYCMEYFIEGGRSRTGKISFPQMGITKYLIEAIDEGYNKDLMFVPTTINYDRILEENSYHKELKGKEKTAETTSAFFKSRKLLKRKYGSVYLSFNDPVSFNELRAQLGDDSLPEKLGDEIAKRISDMIMVTPFALVTTAMLFSSGKGFSREILKKNVSLLYDYIHITSTPVSDSLKDDSNIDEIIDYVIEAYQEDGIVREIELEYSEDEKSNLDQLYALSEDERARINFYKNTIIHLMLPLSFSALGILYAAGKGAATKDEVFRVYLELRDFFSKEFVYPAFMNDDRAVFEKTLAYLNDKSLITVSGSSIEISEGSSDVLQFYSRILQDYFEAYQIVLSTVVKLNKKKISRKDLVSEIRKNGIKMYHFGSVRFMESLSMSSYNNAIKMLEYYDTLQEKFISKKNREIKFKDLRKVDDIRERFSEYLNELNRRSELKLKE